MALIPFDQYSTLQQASDVKTVSDDAVEDAELLAVTLLINSSANTGQDTVLYNHPLSETTVSALQSSGYTVEQRSSMITSSPECQYIISWRS